MIVKKNSFKQSWASLSEFPAEVFEAKKLSRLDLSKNNIRKIPRTIDQLQYIETLNLHSNKIRILFAKLFNLPKLKILVLGSNEIVSLPKQINHLTKLKVLDLSNNKLTQLPDLSGLINLEELNISGNQFSVFPKEIFKLTRLKRLWIAKNDFEDFSGAVILKNLPDLKGLYCYSALRDITRAGISMEYLSFTNLKGNALPFVKQSKNKNPDIVPAMTIQTPAKNPAAVKPTIFISYSHDDHKWLGEVTKHLKVLKLEGKSFELWDDTKLKPGDKWKVEIKLALEKADIAILLVSTSFLASDFIHTDELPPLLKAAQERGTRILPLLVAPCRFLDTPSLAEFQAVNSPGKNLMEVSDAEKEKILMNLASAVDAHLKSLR